MAKKGQKLEPLTLQEMILRGDSEIIRQALEARIQIDSLLEEREAAYRRIAELETQVSEIVGEDGIFPFPAPPLDVATYVQKPAPKKKVEAAPVVEVEVETDTASDEAPVETDEVAEADETVEAETAPEPETKKPSKADANGSKES
jgi:hypothetical protein